MSLGAPTLKRAAAEALKSYPNSVGKAYEFSLQMINEYQESWLIPFLHSSSWHTTPSIEEGFSFGLICNMIEKGFIYLCFIEMPDWAQPNVFGLCVSLPLHKCSNYSKKLIGQIAQNPCYMKCRLI